MDDALGVFEPCKPVKNLIPSKPSNGQGSQHNNSYNCKGVAPAYFSPEEKKGKKNK